MLLDFFVCTSSIGIVLGVGVTDALMSSQTDLGFANLPTCMAHKDTRRPMGQHVAFEIIIVLEVTATQRAPWTLGALPVFLLQMITVGSHQGEHFSAFANFNKSFLFNFF